ncbi:PREDICTED: ubiquitin-like protein 1 [Camelina sativa]|uniref:Ubiquitin-like protein 1 n=1 Tax=Camelina sativa TaxID=90675 RepID=A0ABM1R7E5_CAMSA|nr:PREDICTED: ubiquitin-like protein 1 [Camelina sativa]
MMIKVRDLTGTEIDIEINVKDSIAWIKERIEEKQGIHPSQQKLVFAGTQLADDDQTAKHYDLQPGSLVHLALAVTGG